MHPNIQKKKLNDGNEIPVIGIGTWQLEGEKCSSVVKTALEIGYRHIDTAEQYENQSFIGEVIRGFPRDQLFITSKLQYDYLDPKKVESRVDGTLKELKTDHIDLYLIHWPNSKKPLANILAEMHKCREKGKLKSVGVSNFTIHHIQDIMDQNLSIANNQVEFHPYLYQKKLLDFCNEQKIALTAYSPLAHGKVFDDSLLKQIGSKYKKKASQICLRFLIQLGLIVIPKCSSKEHLKENFEIFDFELEPEEMKQIEALNRDERTLSPPIHEFNY